jgi:hypothetical protein
MLTAIDLNDELRPMTGEIGDVVPQGHLLPKVPVTETVFKHAPQRSLSIRHSLA